jgi:serine/threonine-protein kinase
MNFPTLITLPTEPSALIADAPRTVGRFTIRTEIGRGSNGVVYSAYDPVLSREVAIKAMPLTQNGAWHARMEESFLNEAKIAAGLNHPHIVTVFDAGRTETLAYIAMERLHGRDLHEVIAAGHNLTFRQVASLIARVADAVHFAHKRGLVHRDIKPSNIFLLKDGKPKVLDFGVALAHVADAGSSEKRQLIGTPNYMSPEQALGNKLDPRSDVFSLGTILYELLAGRRAFEGKTIDETLRQVVSDAPPALDTLQPNVPPALIEIVGRALEKDVARRYQTAGELRNALAAFSSQPSTAAANLAYSSGSLQVKLQRSINRAFRGPNGKQNAIAAALLLVVGVAGVTLYALNQDEEEAKPVAAAPAPKPVPIVVAPAPEPPAPAPTAAQTAADNAAAAARAQAKRIVRTDPAKPQRVAPVGDGYVAFAVTPWGEVYVNGVRHGVSPPLTKLTLAPGTHSIEIRNSAAQPFTARIEVKPGQTATVQHRF